MSEAESAAAIPVFVQTAFPEQPELDRWQQITEAEARQVYEMTLRNELSGGTPVVRQFEALWREWTGLRYAITTMNGTAALYSAYFGAGVGPGDEVICPTYTWICTIAPALLLGARPVFAESDPATLQLDPQDVRCRITPRTAAIVAVHLWGNVCDMDGLMAVSRETGVPVIEDCSHAHGATHRGRMVGAIGQVGAWSLQGSKAVSAGEGGVLATDAPEIFERACLVGQVNRMGGIDLVTPRYAALQPLGLGMKFRAHPLGIGIASIQLERLAALNARRQAYVEEVESRIGGLPGLRPVGVYEGAARGGYYAFPVIHLPEEQGGRPTDSFIELLREEGLRAAPSPYGLLHQLEIFRRGFDLFGRGRGPLGDGYAGYRPGDFPVTEDLHRRLVFLPMLSDPVPGAVDAVVDRIERAARRAVRPR